MTPEEEADRAHRETAERLMKLQPVLATDEHNREFEIRLGHPYGAELTYKHPYWWDDEWKLTWDGLHNEDVERRKKCP